MELLQSIHNSLYAQMGNGIYVLFAFLFIISAVAQWRLYSKAGHPGWAAFVPGLNLMVMMRIVGRPDSHAWRFLIPGYNVYFIIRVWIETVQSFGKTSMLDYILVVLLNGIYLFNLAMSYDSVYKGPVYTGSDALAPKPAAGIA